jgi:hypothetical protein
VEVGSALLGAEREEFRNVHEWSLANVRFDRRL